MKLLLGLLLALSCTDLAIEARVSPIDQNLVCKAWVVKDEARGESMKGQRAVLDVVLKRMSTRHLTACEVVMQESQFSGYKKGVEIALHKNVSEKDLDKYTEVDKMGSQCSECTHFHATYVKPNWRNKMKRLLQIGKHVFYEEKEK